MPASGLPAHASLRVHVRTVPAELRPRHSRLCYSFALRRFSLPLHCIPKPAPIKSLTSHAFARPCSSKQRLRCPYQSIAVACRGFASPLPRVALLCVTVAVRCRSWPSYPMPLRIGSLPVLRGAVRFLAHPSPIAPMLCRRLRAALPCSSLAALDIAMPILRRSRLSRAFPSPHRANQSVSFAESRNAFPSQLSA